MTKRCEKKYNEFLAFDKNIYRDQQQIERDIDYINRSIANFGERITYQSLCACVDMGLMYLQLEPWKWAGVM